MKYLKCLFKIYVIISIIITFIILVNEPKFMLANEEDDIYEVEEGFYCVKGFTTQTCYFDFGSYFYACSTKNVCFGPEFNCCGRVINP